MRILHKFDALNSRFFGLIDDVMLSVKSIKDYTDTFEYLNKYSYVLDNLKKIETSDKYKDKIWQMWLQGEDAMPPVVKKCTESVKKYHPDEVILLDNSNLSDYIELPDYIMDKYKKGIIPVANLSDMIRTTLLSKYGGCWVDSTIYLTGKIPEDILNSEFFTFRTYGSSVYKHINNFDELKVMCNHIKSDIPPGSSFFLRSAPGGDIVNGVLALFLEYWKYENQVIDYLMIDRFLSLVLTHSAECRKQFFQMPEYNVEDLMLLQDALFEHYDEKLFSYIKKVSNVHKATHKNLKRSPFKDSVLEYLLNTPVEKV